MTKFTYKLETLQGKQAKDAEEFLVLIRKGCNKNNPASALKYFFNDEKTKALINENNWDEVFEYWEPCTKKGGYPNWAHSVLADFLYLLDIKFWNYFTKDIKYYSDAEGFWLLGIEEVEDYE